MITNPDRLIKVGPLSPVNGFPLWYKDSQGTRLELVGDANDPNAPAVGEPQPTQGTPGPNFPPAFPDEAFYMLAEARMVTGGQAQPGRARVVLALEATFGGTGDVVDGQQIVFGRLRVRIDGAVPGALYTFTHPYGQTDPLPADERGRVFVTEDIGVTPLAFEGALQSHVAPFLHWTSGAARAPGEAEPPAGHIGDGDSEHTITGSPLVDANGKPMNYVRIEGPNISDAGGPRDPDDPLNVNKIFTPLFVLQGRLATIAGVEITRAVYTRSAAGAVTIDVFAESEPGQTIVVSGVGLPDTPMQGANGNYFLRLDAGNLLPAAVTVTNTTDAVPSAKTVNLTDAVVITAANYDSAAQTLTVAAHSTDEAAPPALTVSGPGLVDAPPGALSPLAAPPVVLTVTSALGGTSTETVTGVG